MKTRIIGFLQVLLVVGLVVAAIVFSREDKTGVLAQTQPADAGDLQAPAAMLVRTLIPVVSPATVQVSATGSVGVRNQIILTPEVSGRILSMDPSLREGGTFAAGQILLTIDPKDFELALAQAEADIASAQANLLLQRAQSDAAVANYALLNGDKAVPALVARLPQINQGQAQLAAATARAQIARLNLARTQFSLPFAGKVTSSRAEVGQLLTKGQAFGEVFALDALEVTVPISQADLKRLEPVVLRQATLESQNRTYEARVVRRSAQLDERTRFGKLFLALEDADPLVPGAFVDVVLAGDTVAATYTLPLAAQQPGGIMWVVKAGELASVVPAILHHTNTDVVVEAFDVHQGVVLGSVPGGQIGTKVRIAEPE